MLKLICLLLSLRCESEIPPKIDDPCLIDVGHLSISKQVDIAIGCSNANNKRVLKNWQIQDIIDGVPQV